jgi:hypothetical protein
MSTTPLADWQTICTQVICPASHNRNYRSEKGNKRYESEPPVD